MVICAPSSDGRAQLRHQFDLVVHKIHLRKDTASSQHRIVVVSENKHQFRGMSCLLLSHPGETCYAYPSKLKITVDDIYQAENLAAFSIATS